MRARAFSVFNPPLLPVLLLFISSIAHGSEKLTINDRLERVREAMTLVQQIRNSIDRSQFELDSLLDRLEFDDSKIVSFVSSDIAYQAYDGTLRAAVGTLYSRSGNSLDQSVLLAKLLNDAGYDARIAGADMSTEISNALVAAIQAERSAISPIVAVKKYESIMDELAQVAPNSEGEQADFLSLLSADMHPAESAKAQAKRAAEFFLKKHMGTTAAKDQPELLDQPESGYFWVQYKDTASEGWKDIHPALAKTGIKDLNAPDAKVIFTDSVPASLQHRVRFELILEVATGAKLSRQMLMNPLEIPAANLIDQTISISNLPTGISATMDALDLGEEPSSISFANSVQNMANEDNLFVPLVNGALPAGGKYFDLNGNVIDSMAATNQAAGLFKELNQKVGGAIGGIAGEKTAPKTSAQILKITTITPQEKETIYERYMFDRLTPAGRANGTLEFEKELGPRESPLGDTNVSIVTGEVPHAKVLDLALQQVIHTQTVFEWLLDGEVPPEKDVEKRRLKTGNAFKKPLDSVSLLELYLLIYMMDEPSRSDYLSYRSQPLVLALSHKMGISNSQATQLTVSDIFNNARTIVKRDGGQLLTDRDRAVSQGAWDTWAEHIIFGLGIEEDSGSSTKLMNETRMDSTHMFASHGEPPLLMVQSVDEVPWDSIPLESHKALREDINAGNLVFLPTARAKTNSEFYVWWRLDPSDGTTLGRGWDGRGIVTVRIVFEALNMAGSFVAARFTQGLAAYGICVFAKGLVFLGTSDDMYYSPDQVHNDLLKCGASFLNAIILSPANVTKAIIGVIYAILTD